MVWDKAHGLWSHDLLCGESYVLTKGPAFSGVKQYCILASSILEELLTSLLLLRLWAKPFPAFWQCGRCVQDLLFFQEWRVLRAFSVWNHLGLLFYMWTRRSQTYTAMLRLNTLFISECCFKTSNVLFSQEIDSQFYVLLCENFC